jgi:hypothetical protein
MSSLSHSEGGTPNSSPARDSDDQVSVDSTIITENFFEDTSIPEFAPSSHTDFANGFSVEASESESNPQPDLTPSAWNFDVPQQSAAPCQNCGHLSFGSSGESTSVHSHSPAVPPPIQQAQSKPKKAKMVTGKQKKPRKHCPSCRKAYVRTDELAGHIAGKHCRVTFQCPVTGCKYSAKLAATLLKHFVRSHKDVKIRLPFIAGFSPRLLPACASDLGALREAFQIAKTVKPE